MLCYPSCRRLFISVSVLYRFCVCGEKIQQKSCGNLHMDNLCSLGAVFMVVFSASEELLQLLSGYLAFDAGKRTGSAACPE